MRRLAFVAMLLSSACAASSSDIEVAADGSWTPKVEFTLEDSDVSQTLTWVSGWSYALTAVAGEQSRQGGPRWFCPPDRNRVESRVMLDILNAQFAGQRISADQAAAALWRGVREKYPCHDADKAQSR